MNDKNSPIKEKKAPGSKRKLIKIGVIGLAVLLLTGAPSYVAWMQTSKLSASKKDGQKQITQLATDVATLKAQQKQLKEENEQLKAVIAEDSTIKLPTVSVLDSMHYNGTPVYYDETNHSTNAIFHEGSDFMLVKIRVTNESDKTVYFNTAEFKLKDTSNDITIPDHTSLAGRFAVSVPDNYLPAGNTHIRSQSLRPNETVNGMLVFYGQKDIPEAVLTYGSNSFNVPFPISKDNYDDNYRR